MNQNLINVSHSMNGFPNSTIGDFLWASLHDMHKNSHKHESDFVYHQFVKKWMIFLIIMNDKCMLIIP
jgi:hypothetical protein